MPIPNALSDIHDKTIEIPTDTPTKNTHLFHTHLSPIPLDPNNNSFTITTTDIYLNDTYILNETMNDNTFHIHLHPNHMNDEYPHKQPNNFEWYINPIHVWHTLTYYINSNNNNNIQNDFYKITNRRLNLSSDILKIIFMYNLIEINYYYH